jgi:adenylyltransferase/sulfurtransferase
MLSEKEKKQYNRHLILSEIGLDGQNKLKSAKVLVIGAGGLGCPVLQYLAAAGVGTIGIIDHDRIDQSNLQRQVLFTHQDIGAYKADVAANRLSQLNPFILFKTFTEKLTPDNAISIFNLFDIVVDGTDNFPTRYLINDAAVLTDKPVVFGSIYKFEGQVSVFNYENGPTYRCIFPDPPKPGEVPNCSEIGVLGVLPGIIGSFQANEVIKLICNIGMPLSGKLLTFNALNMQQMILNIEKNESIDISELSNQYEEQCELPMDVQEILLTEINKTPEKYHLLDVRSNEEREMHHIGGQHIPFSELELRFKEIPENQKIVVYCKKGITSKQAIIYLQNQDLKNDWVNLTGGLINQ